MDTVAADLRPALEALNDLFTRSYYSAAGYVFESQPFVVAEDADLLDLLSSIRREDRRHAQLLAGVIDDLEAVPLAGAFPYWHRDLNYLTVPYLAVFVVESLREDVRRYRAAQAVLPSTALGAKATLTAILRDKEAQIARLEPQAKAARERETADYKAKIAARKAARAARLAKEKAAKEGAKKAAAAKPAGAPATSTGSGPSAAGLDPNEPGITPKEKARRVMLQKRGGGGDGGAAGAVPVPSTGPKPGGAPATAGLDPNEPGITPKEKARRQMLAKRGPSTGSGPTGGGAPAASAPAPVAAGADLPDPDEPGISPKEKARRQMLRKRAAAGGGVAAPAAAAPAAPAPAEDIPDPDEPGISPKEKARRQMLRKRAASTGSAPSAAGATAAPAAPAPVAAAAVPASASAAAEEEDLDPDEEGISPKEKARRTMLRKRRAAK